MSDGFLENVNKVGAILKEGLEKIQRESNKITDIRATGLMIGVDTVFKTSAVIKALQKNGLMTTQAGNSLRMVPPLIITEDHAHEALDIIAKTLQEDLETE